jgi:centrosomal CEP192-like protein
MAARRTLLVSTLFLLARSAPSQRANSSLEISPASIAFPAQAVGAQSAPLSLTVNNSTSSAIRLDQVLSSGIDFNAKSNCGPELTSGSSCTIEVTFKPAISGERMGILEVLSSDKSSPHFIPLSGIGE